MKGGDDDYGGKNACDVELYDVAFWPYLGDKEFWSDYDEAKSLGDDVIDECGDGDDEDIDCYLDGCRWSLVYGFCGVTMVLIAANTVLQIIGVWSYILRALGASCGLALCCVNFAALITTAVLRWNTWGRLAALSTLPTKSTGGDFVISTDQGYPEVTSRPLSDERDYESDGGLIVGLLVVQTIFCCCNCLFMGY